LRSVVTGRANYEDAFYSVSWFTLMIAVVLSRVLRSSMPFHVFDLNEDGEMSVAQST
jgi:hypothetical protein